MTPTTGRQHAAYLPWVVLLVLAGGVGLSLAIANGQRKDSIEADALRYLPNGDYLKVAVLGYRQIASDLLWIKAVQHLGGRTQTREGYLAGYHAIDVLTDVDPSFIAPYRIGGMILSVWAGLHEESRAILQKGMKHHPTLWEFPFFIGYDYYFEQHDPANAARYFQQAAQLPGAPAYLPNLAARMTVEAGDPSAALEFLQHMYRGTEDERLRERLIGRMREVEIEKDLRALEEAIAGFRTRYGKNPIALDDLMRAGMMRRIPTNPRGGFYDYDSKTGAVSSSLLKERLHIYRH